MKIIGVIGGCGSGKSVVSDLFQNRFNAYIIDADEIAHNVIRKDSRAYKKIVNHFGKHILDDNGNINRSKLGKLVFADEKELQQLTDITHPYINEDITNIINTLKNENKYGYMVLEITALGKGKIYSLIDEYWYIYCDIDVRIERLLKYRNISTESAMNIISKQLSDKEFRKYADVIIDNSNTLDITYNQMKKYLD
ncbi:dephospho-CoA kinase [Vallitalea sp.]|jgi:dephospho-CoA kinase|uniref:dephospho-CoA kinase n=1 Tax=Vallitalea sp. TaxID=1882829 RepID=UPI0025D2CB90|nr:dephospho-CoA kinase [Vallitalea sp.]MCT4688420.1 dephospho-CoA kinase [Vallitalea sp.]